MDDLFENKELDRRWWSPMRRGIVPEDLPKQMRVVYRNFDEYRIEFFRDRC
jgi:hypothetical protein